MRRIIKTILIAAGVTVVLIMVLNFDYFRQNISYLLRASKPAIPTDVTSASAKLPANTLVIDSLGIKAPIVYTTEKTEAAFQQALRNGVVHYPGTANPGEAGNCYIFGHSSDYAWSKGSYKTVFALLPRISKGAEIKITDSGGKVFTYTVTNAFVASAKDVKYLDQQGFQKKLLTLQTSYPVGTALKRFIVQAVLK